MAAEGGKATSVNWPVAWAEGQRRRFGSDPANTGLARIHRVDLRNPKQTAVRKSKKFLWRLRESGLGERFSGCGSRGEIHAG